MTYGYHPRMPDELEQPVRENPAGEKYVENIHRAVKEARHQLKEAQNRQKMYADSERRHVTFEPGDLVLLRTANLQLKVPGAKKLLPKYVGPFALEKQVGKMA